jgi:hypothetical protein
MALQLHEVSSKSFEKAQFAKTPVAPLPEHDFPVQRRANTSEVTLPADPFAQILSTCKTNDADLEKEMNRRRIFSLKLDLRAIKELEQIAGLVREEDFVELPFFPKMQDFLANIYHNEREKQAFWLTVRIRHLSSLTPRQRVKAIQEKDRTWGNPLLLLTEVFKLPALSDRLRLISQLSFREFEALLKETEKRKISLQAEEAECLHSNLTQEREDKYPLHNTWFALGGK